MSKICLNYLRNSFLYSYDLCEKKYSGYSDGEIQGELQKYRNFVVENIEGIKSEIKTDSRKLDICVESFHNLPSQDFFRQMILYMDQVVVFDPVFAKTEMQTSFSKAMGEYIGLSKDKEFDREKLVEDIDYVRNIGELIDNDFVVMLPISLIHESPKEIPIQYSDNLFSDCIPTDILEYYRSIAHVYNLEKSDSGLRLDRGKALSVGTNIFVDFEGQGQSNGNMYQYVEQTITNYDQNTGKCEVRIHIPDSIDKRVFDTWVNQSINQAANHHFNERYKELVFSKECGCMYLTCSPLTAKVISMSIEKPSVESRLASLAVKLDLPIVDNIQLKELINIRNNYGEAFQNFRTELNSRLLSIDSITDPELIAKELDRIRYEMMNIQVEEVNKEYRKIMRTLKYDAVTAIGSLIASIPTGGLTLVGTASAIVKGVADISKYFSDVHENNGFFLWKVKSIADKQTI